MPKFQLSLTSLVLTALITLCGCSFPGVYKIDIQQGNVVTQDMIDELRPGMSKAQVRYIMGNPLITDTFHAKRWDYLYSLQTGSGEKNQKRMSLYFNEGDQLIAVSGDFRLKPGKTRDEAILDTNASLEHSATTARSEAQALIREANPAPKTAQSQTASNAPSPVTPQASKEFPDSTQRPSSLEEQIQRELDNAQPIPQQQPGQL